MPNLRQQFLIDPDVIFLNHGSFGATPKPVFDIYQDWQRRLENQPVKFCSLNRDLTDNFAIARAGLSTYLNCHPDDLAYVPNATFGVNVVARSLELQPNDEVLTTNHEYGACANAWRYMSQQQGYSYVEHPIPLQFTTQDDLLETFWAGVTERTKVIYLSHITSATATTFPVAAICARARQHGILTVVDGAHAPGQIPLDLTAIDADFYTGNCHKWLCAPKGAAFLYARRDQQYLIRPLVIGWGWDDEQQTEFGSDFLNYTQFLGTNDLSAYFSVPAAIDFQAQHNWDGVRAECHQLAQHWVHALCDFTGLDPIHPDNEGFYHQLALAPLPHQTDLAAFKARLYDEHRVEMPTTTWQDRQFLRISVQGYNTPADIEASLKAIKTLLS